MMMYFVYDEDDVQKNGMNKAQTENDVTMMSNDRREVF